MKYYRLITLLTIGFIASIGNIWAQNIEIDNFKAHKVSGPSEEEFEIYLEFSLSDLSATPMIEVKVGQDSNCEGIPVDILHIKKYTDGYYLKHKGELKKISSSKISTNIIIDKMMIEMNPFVCIMTRNDKKITSNIVSVSLND